MLLIVLIGYIKVDFTRLLRFLTCFVSGATRLFGVSGGWLVAPRLDQQLQQ